MAFDNKDTVKFKVGNVVKSLQGNDKGNLYLVMSIDVKENVFLNLIDGFKHTFTSPKRKNIKHIELVSDCCISNISIDSDVIKILKDFRNKPKN